MVTITAEVLKKISARSSGQAMKVAIDGTTPEDIGKVLTQQGVSHRVSDASSLLVLDDSQVTVVSGHGC